MNMVRAHQDAAAESDQGVVDEPLAGEADEIHAPVVVPPAAAGVGEADGQPQSDRQVQGCQHPCAAFGSKGDVDDDGGGDERHASQKQARPIEIALPREVAGQKRQHEEAEVAPVEERRVPLARR